MAADSKCSISSNNIHKYITAICRMLKNNEISCSHVIKIKNLNDGDIIAHTLLLIRGFVSPIKNCKSLIHLSEGTQCLSSNPSYTGEFKFILDLSCYINETRCIALKLHFKFCNNESYLKLSLDLQKRAYRLQPLYILCSDEDENSLAKLNCQIIDLNLRLIQALYADRIHEAGFPLKTFCINSECKIFRSDLKISQALAADEHTLWRYFAEEFLRKNQFEVADFSCKLKLVAFIGCTSYDGEAVVASGDLSYESIKQHLKAHSALGGGDLALFGSAFFYAWPHALEQIIPCLLNNKAVDVAKEADESNYRRTYAGVYATTLGAVCHELGHIFDLGHDAGIMGTGFDYANRVLIHSSHTENLPKRIIGHLTVEKVQLTKISRFTQLKRNENNFLENYREQKKNDGFFFTHNCALILIHHKWFSNLKTIEEHNEINLITFNYENGLLKSNFKMLKIIEIRTNADSKVACFYEIKDYQTTEFKIPNNVLVKHKQTHHLYIMTTDGLGQRFELS